MNIQQLEYIVAIDNHRHFAKAADACHVTQPTLSMMVQKLEEELEVKIFDRTAHPVETTAIGQQIIEQARVALRQLNRLKAIAENERKMVKGPFRLAIIPTIAAYVVPELLNSQRKSHNRMELMLQEKPTHRIIEDLLNGTIDGGLMAGPLNHPKLVEYPLYYEQFFAYVSPKEKWYKRREIDLEKIDINNLWLLENVHCLRGQIERLCQLKKRTGHPHAPVSYEAGSIDTLINVVDNNAGLTIIPEMAAMSLSEERQEHLRTFKGRRAYREVSLFVSVEYVRKAMLEVVQELVKASVPKSMQDIRLKSYTVELDV